MQSLDQLVFALLAFVLNHSQLIYYSHPFKDVHLTEPVLIGKLRFPIKHAELFSSFIVESGT